MEERMSQMEATVRAQGEAYAVLRADLGRFDERVDSAFVRLDDRLTAFETRVDARFTQVDARFTQVDARFTQLDGRVDRLDDKVSRQFVWLVGMQMTTLIAVVGALLARS